MLTLTVERERAPRSVAGILRRIERAIPLPGPAESGLDAAVREAFVLGARCMAAQVTRGPLPTREIAAAGTIARVTCAARFQGHGRAIESVRGSM